MSDITSRSSCRKRNFNEPLTLRLLAAGLGESLPADCETRLLLSSTLADTSRQLQHLKRVVSHAKSRSKAAAARKPLLAARNGRRGSSARKAGGGGARLEKGGKCPDIGSGRTGEQQQRRRRVMKWSVVVNLVGMLVMLVAAWATQPTCCDTYTPTFSLHPQLRYINPPPI